MRLALLVATVVVLGAVSTAASQTTPFNLGPNPVPARGTFTNGRGGCPLATTFADDFQFHAPGNGTLTITQPSTGDRVSGPIDPTGTFRLRSSGETYDGRITGKSATATYTYTMTTGCTETYDASFVLQLPESDLELTITAPARATIKQYGPRTYGRVTYRVVVTNNGDSTSPSARVVFRSSRPLGVNHYRWGAEAGVPQGKQIASCGGHRAVVVWTCRVPELHEGESAGIAILAQAARPGVYTTMGTVTGVNFDPVLANNRATRRTQVRR